MRGLILTVSLVALAGFAVASEPQKSTVEQETVVASAQIQAPAAAQRVPQKMTDQQLENIVAGSSNDVWLITNHGGLALRTAPSFGGAVFV